MIASLVAILANCVSRSEGSRSGPVQHHFVLDPQWLARRCQDAKARAPREKSRRKARRRLDDVLAVVEHQQRIRILDACFKPFQQRRPRPGGRPERTCRCVTGLAGIPRRRELHEPGFARGRRRSPQKLQAEPRLAASARPNHAHDPRPLQRGPQFIELSVPAYERGQRGPRRGRRWLARPSGRVARRRKRLQRTPRSWRRPRMAVLPPVDRHEGHAEARRQLFLCQAELIAQGTDLAGLDRERGHRVEML